ncbi:NADP-dependent oxidoreductase [Mesorhizobium sp. M00.F.Ca.ET.186.01.1.1]|nr:NADP-dependent oxidoreductase [bacterium M00.F.Ca.ET.205.01.1.1]TGU53345.1 NADP-dependent oxidoreductase [bacterium M00.F.Ca.ET.152.01.1.1]TGV36859.1 NADP-dependent oxidoreductase [Mesorhizobium sp. M00.F.Ca.ET.186.01.1.1]TGZ41726.1 NADP-dependent oxidoreductase [bacterium M00.F.Ca.ET.162.01.1.1]
MKRIQYHRYGGPEEMRLEDFELDRPMAGQIVVRVKAAAANPVDWKIRNGALKFMTGRRFPRAMGSDFSGVVEAVGPSVTRFNVGDDVLGTLPAKAGGAFADRLMADEKVVILKPAALSFEQAATLPIVGVTAWRGLVDKARLQRGQSVFVHGCLGGVGRMATQLAKSLGADVSGSCRATAMDDARVMGLNRVVDYRQFSAETLQGQFDVVFDTAGTLSLRDGRTLLKPGGVVLDISPSPGKLLGLFLSRQHKLVVAKISTEVLTKVAEVAATGRLRSEIGKTVPLAMAIPALTALEKQGTPQGKLVITWGQS